MAQTPKKIAPALPTPPELPRSNSHEKPSQKLSRPPKGAAGVDPRGNKYSQMKAGR
jgi:hypothetical protein